MDNKEAQKEFFRIIDEYIEDDHDKENIRQCFPDAVRGAVYEIDEIKKKAFSKEDYEILKDIFFQWGG